MTAVLNPVGYPSTVKGKALAPRLESLDGKTVFLVDCRFDDSGLLLEQVRAWFAEHMPGVTTRIVQKNRVYAQDDPETWQRNNTSDKWYSEKKSFTELLISMFDWYKELQVWGEEKESE